MATDDSPSHFNKNFEDMLNEEKFKIDINQKMKVPSRISFNPDANGVSQNTWNNENINMQVPERILVVGGQQQMIGTKSHPREIVYDNSLLQSTPYPGDVRVATPPRQLTLDKYPFPGVSDHDHETAHEDLDEDFDGDDEQQRRKNKVAVAPKNHLNDSSFSYRDSTPPLGYPSDGLSTTEEVQHLRKQMAKLNRRVMALELEHLNRLQREKYVYALGIAYFLMKTIVWLNRN